MKSNEQAIIVKKALDLTKSLESETEKLNQLKLEKFKPIPCGPAKDIIMKAPYPEIKIKTKFNWLTAIIPSFIFFPWFIIYLVIYNSRKESEEKKIRNSEEYINQCQEIDRQQIEQQAIADEKYIVMKKEYDEVIIPKYNEELAEWENQHNIKLEETEKEVERLRYELEDNYQTTKIIPMQYRDIDALTYLYELMSTSDYEIKEAIDMYDKNMQRQLSTAHVLSQQQANELAKQQNDLAIEQNQLLDEQNEISERARREARTAAIISTIQRHNTNSILNKISKK